jgi:hypothetical protein
MGEPRKNRSRAPPSLHYPEGSSVEKVSKWAGDHPDKLHVNQLLNKENLEFYLGYPEGKWPSGPRDLPVTRAPVREDPPAKLSSQVEKRKAEGKEGEPLPKRSRASPSRGILA